MKTLLTLFIVFCSITSGQEAILKSDKREESFSPQALQKYIISKGLKHPKIAYAQTLLETGWYSSTIFKENNNLFGMKYVGDFKYKYGRPTTAVGSRYDHAVYTHWKKSVDDYLLWQQMFKRTPIESENDYLRLLGKRYAESSHYIKALHSIMKSDTTRWQNLTKE